MTDSESKRRRLSWASPGKLSPGAALQIVPSGHHEQQDIIEFFAQRGEQKKALESQVQSLEVALRDLQARLTQSEAAVATHKVHTPLFNADESPALPSRADVGRLHLWLIREGCQRRKTWVWNGLRRLPWSAYSRRRRT